MGSSPTQPNFDFRALIALETANKADWQAFNARQYDTAGRYRFTSVALFPGRSGRLDLFDRSLLYRSR